VPRVVREYGGILVAFGLLALLGLVLPRPFIMEVLIFGIYVMAFSFLAGHLGLVSFGQPAYLGLGAYGAAMYLYYYGTNPYAGILAGIVAGAVVSAIIGAFLVKLAGDYFALANLAFCAIAFFVFQKALVGVTRGDTGLWYLAKMLPTPVLNLKNPDHFFGFVFAVAIAVWVLFRYIEKSVYGAVCIATKINERKVQFLGYRPFYIKWLGFVIANTVAALAGCLYAIYFGFVSPALMDLTRVAEVVIAGLLGGVGTLYGPLVGAFAYIGMKDLVSDRIAYWELVVGMLLVLVMLAGEKGIVGTLEPYARKVLGRQHLPGARTARAA